ncbi:MAG: tyrosine-type recombinase/integrase [Turicibacter sp.]|nr:tyrosine-type recombinase/integrase [Turicibacter sp.]
MATKTVKNRLRINQTKEMTLKQLYDEHMEYSKARNFRPQTLENNEFNFIVMADYFGDDFLIEDITTGAINGYINYLLDKRKVKVITVNERLKHLRKLMNYAYKCGYCHKVNIELLKDTRENKTPLTQEEVQKLIAKPTKMMFSEVRSWTIANLVISTGIRSRNVREVKVKDLDLHNRTLYLRDTKSHKPQTIYLSHSIIKILNEWLKITQLKGDSPLFPSVYGEELSNRSLKNIFRAYARSRGVETSLHILRHTYARDLVKADVNPVIIKELLNHSSLETTQRYIKLFGSEIQQATEGLDTLAQYQKNRIKLGGSK